MRFWGNCDAFPLRFVTRPCLIVGSLIRRRPWLVVKMLEDLFGYFLLTGPEPTQIGDIHEFDYVISAKARCETLSPFSDRRIPYPYRASWNRPGNTSSDHRNAQSFAEYGISRLCKTDYTRCFANYHGKSRLFTNRLETRLE